MSILSRLARLAAPILLGLWPALASAQGDGAALREAFTAGEEGDWETAAALADAIGPVAADLIEWTRLRDGVGSYEDALVFLARRPGWPGLDLIREEAEGHIPPDLPPADIVAFFAGRSLPESGAGVLALARAYEDLGQRGDAEALVVQAWLTMALDATDQLALQTRYADLLEPYHAARTDMLLWRWRRSDAATMLPLLDADQRALAEARIAYIRGDSDVSAELAAVPEALRAHPGLLYDRYSWLASKGRREDAIEVLTAASTSAEALGQPFRWSGWRRELVRWSLREGDPQTAYTLASRHFLTAEDGTAFADLEFLAGWIALRDLDQPQVALVHFQALAQAVDGPISLARGHYWTGRAQEALGNVEGAQAAYAAGAEHQTAFYGLLSADKLGRPLDPALAGAGAVEDWQNAEVMELDTVQAGLLLLGAGERGKAVLFFRDIGQTLEGPQLDSLGLLLDEMDEEYFALLLGKSAALRGVILPRLLHPVHGVGRADLPVEAALNLAIARQESEFRADAGSPVGALGLMQLMPATAEEVAGELGLPYSRARLTSDWEYNAALGSKYLLNLQERFGDSPVMIAAGYNAGPSRPAIWMDERGDPRIGEADIVDWIETIPFSETRNYVMRVTEAIPVYRARLTGQTGPVRFEALLRGDKPLVRPVARPVSSPAVLQETVAPTEPAAPEAPSGPTSIRPIARPGG